MTRSYSMAYLTANGADPVSAVTIAAEAGYDAISFRLRPVAPGDVVPDLMGDAALVREVKAALADTGLRFSDAELIRLGPDGDIGGLEPFLERIADMGARHILTAVDDPDLDRAAGTFGRLCELVAGYGLTADLEFMPWTGAKTVNDARKVVEAAGHTAGAILFDTLHFDRGASTLEDLAAVPAGLFNYVQVCDGPVPYDPTDAGMIHVARQARLIPGDGGIDLGAIVARLPEGVPVSVEVPNVEQAAAMGRTDFAKAALTATKALMGDS